MSAPSLSRRDLALRSPPSRGAVTKPEAGRAFAGLRIASSIAEAAAAWDALEQRAIVSPYQRRDWLAAWAATSGLAAGLAIAIVIAEDAAGRPVGLVPLGVTGGGLLRKAIFLGGRETNYNMGLFDPAAAWTPGEAARLLRTAAKHIPGGLDMIVLAHQPLAWDGIANPLAALPRSQPSPSISHKALLQWDGEAFLRAHQSAATRKKIRSKAAYLTSIGVVAYRVARTPEAIAAVVTAHIAQKAAKLTTIGVAPPDSAALHRLFIAAATPMAGADAPLELHALYCGETIVATFGGLARQRRFSGLLISYASDPPYARASPGELLLTMVLRAKCAEGFESFDLGIGEARYKDTYCPLPDPLVDVFLPLSPTGHLIAALDALRLRVKSTVKRTPQIWAMAQTLRKTVGRLRSLARR